MVTDPSFKLKILAAVESISLELDSIYFRTCSNACPLSREFCTFFTVIAILIPKLHLVIDVPDIQFFPPVMSKNVHHKTPVDLVHHLSQLSMLPISVLRKMIHLLYFFSTDKEICPYCIFLGRYGLWSYKSKVKCQELIQPLQNRRCTVFTGSQYQ